MAISVALAASVVTAVVPFESTFATYRGGLSARAREITANDLFLGLGPTHWQMTERLTSAYPNYSPHNIWLELLVGGGLIAVVLIAIAGLCTALSVPRDDRFLLYLLLASVLALGTLEAPFSPAKLGLAPFALFLPLMIAGGYGEQRATATLDLQTKSPRIRMKGAATEAPRRKTARI